MDYQYDWISFLDEQQAKSISTKRTDKVNIEYVDSEECNRKFPNGKKGKFRSVEKISKCRCQIFWLIIYISKKFVF